MVTGLNVLVSGSSIAGPAAAYWLLRAGNRVTLIERSEQLRLAGQNIDVRGTGREVLRRMNLEDAVLARNTGEVGTRFVDDAGNALLELPAGTSDSDGSTAEAEVLRGELSELLLDALPGDVGVSFGQRIVDISQDDDGATVTLRGQPPQRFDLVVVAEGARSSTRGLVFGEVPTRPVGLYTVFGTIPRTASDDQWWNWYTATGGRSITVRPDNKGTTRVALSFLSPPRGYEDRTIEEQRKIVGELFGDAGWMSRRIVGALASADELYVDYLTQVFAPTYGFGRVVLLGDAAWCATPLSGMGTTLALTGAYVLAGELARADSIEAGCKGYQDQMRGFVEKAQKLPPGAPRLVHPKSRLGVRVFRTVLRAVGSRPIQIVAQRIPSRPAHSRELPQYPELRD